MKAEQRKKLEIERLEYLRTMAQVGEWGDREQMEVINFLIRLTHRTYEDEINQEKSDELNEQTMSEMTWEDFN